MGIRAKLLVILLILAVVPLLVAAVVSRGTMHSLGDRLTTEAEQRVVEEERRQLGVIATSMAETVRARATEIERILRLQTISAVRALESEPAQDVWYDARLDFDAARRAVPGMVEREIVGLDGATHRTQQVSMEHQAMLLREGEGQEERERTASRLASMDAVYRSIAANRPVLLYGQYVSTMDGVHAKFPGHGGYPDDFDPRKRSWFELVEASMAEMAGGLGPMWGPPIFDAATGQLIITTSMAMIGSAGDFLGVSAVDVRIADVLSGVPESLPWANEARALITVIVDERETPLQRLMMRENGRLPEAGTMLVLAERDQTVAGLSWTTRPRSDVFRLDDESQLERLIDDIVRGEQSMIDCSIGGEAFLCAYTPFRFEGDGDRTALVLLVPRAAVETIPEEIRRSIDRQITTQLATNAGLLLAAIALVIAAALLLSKRLTQPVNELAAAAQRVAGGDLDTEVRVAGGDELGELARSFNEMLPQLRDRIALRHSLTLAKDVQQQLLPQQAPRVDGLDVAGASVYCDETGGDYYDFFDLSDRDGRGLAVLIGDVTGHGVAAALLMTTARATLRTLIGREHRLSTLMSDLNDNLAGDTGDGRFMTMNLSFLQVLEDGSVELRWASAGHDPPMFADQDGLPPMDGGGIPLGIQSGWVYDEYAARLQPGQVLLIGTDGIWEARNRAGEMFGKDRLREVLRAHREKSAESICSAVIAAVTEFRAGSAQADDITLVVVRVVPGAHENAAG